MSDQAEPVKKPFYRRVKRWQIITLIVVIAAFARLWAAWQLPVDADEPTYLKAGQDYAQMIKAGDLAGILHYDYNQEHPALVKLMYSLPYIFIQPRFGVPVEMTIDRLISVFWGVLAVLVLALIDPLAGIFLALDTMVIKYTSQVYLESLPLFAGLLAIYAFRRYNGADERGRWLWVSAVSIGAAVAGKYLYALMGIPILTMFIWMKPRRWKELFFYLVVALATFFILDPSLWSDPIGRLWSSLSFHLSYSTSSLDVITAAYPWYQALNWISAMVPWHPEVFMIPGPDPLIFYLAVFGMVWAWKRWPWAVVWAVGAFLVLLAWPTKWPQYTLTLIPALCLIASTGLRKLAGWIKSFDDFYSLSESVLPQPGKAFWVVLIVFAGALLAGELSYQVSVAMARSGWTTVQTETTPLPSNAVHALLQARDGQMVIATDGGVSFWRPDDRSPWGDSNQTLTTKNSGLVDGRVLSLLEDRNGGWWFGTVAGLSFWDGRQGWTTYRAADLGLPGDQIQCLLQDSQGRIWAGTKAGAAVWDGKTWKAVTAGANGLADDTVFAMAEQASGGDASYIWFGTLKGVSRLDEQSGSWQSYDLSGDSLDPAGVTDLLVRQDGKLWAATSGDGLSVWDGQSWTALRTSNSDIPLNNVTRMIEASPGVFWIGFSYASQPGGMMARFDGKAWQGFDNTDSGENGSEPDSLALDGTGKLWIGSPVNGLQIYQVQ